MVGVLRWPDDLCKITSLWSGLLGFQHSGQAQILPHAGLILHVMLCQEFSPITYRFVQFCQVLKDPRSKDLD